MLPDPRRSAAFLLTGLSALLSAGSTLADLGARALRPSGRDAGGEDEPVTGAPTGPRPRADAPTPAPPRARADGPPTADAPPPPGASPTPSRTAAATPTPPTVSSTPPAPAPPRSVLDEGDTGPVGDAGTTRTSESHTEELAGQPAASVIRAIRDLSTDELGRLYEYEQAHRARKSVLAAIERATAPGAG